MLNKSDASPVVPSLPIDHLDMNRLFIRGRPDLCKHLKRTKIKGKKYCQWREKQQEKIRLFASSRSNDSDDETMIEPGFDALDYSSLAQPHDRSADAKHTMLKPTQTALTSNFIDLLSNHDSVVCLEDHDNIITSTCFPGQVASGNDSESLNDHKMSQVKKNCQQAEMRSREALGKEFFVSFDVPSNATTTGSICTESHVDSKIERTVENRCGLLSMAHCGDFEPRAIEEMIQKPRLLL